MLASKSIRARFFTSGRREKKAKSVGTNACGTRRQGLQTTWPTQQSALDAGFRKGVSQSPVGRRESKGGGGGGGGEREEEGRGKGLCIYMQLCPCRRAGLLSCMSTASSRAAGSILFA